MTEYPKSWYFHPCEGGCGCVLPEDPVERDCPCESSCSEDVSWPMVLPVYSNTQPPAGAINLATDSHPVAVSWRRVSVDGLPKQGSSVLYWPSGRYPEFRVRFDLSSTARGGDLWLPLDDLYKIPVSKEQAQMYEIPVDAHVIAGLLEGKYPSNVALEKIVDSIASAAGSTAPPSASR